MTETVTERVDTLELEENNLDFIECFENMVIVHGIGDSSISAFIPEIIALSRYRNSITFHFKNGAKFLEVVVSKGGDFETSKKAIAAVSNIISQYHLDMYRNSQ